GRGRRGVLRLLARAPRARGAAADGADGDRARVLGRPVPERGVRLPERPSRHGEDADAERPPPPGRPAGGGARVTSRPPDFHELVGEDLPADERERLRGVHDLLVAAGPPAELSPALERAPSVGGTVRFLPRRRRGAVLLLAAALAAAAFGGGFLTGAVTHGGSKSAVHVISMHGPSAAPNALAGI